MVVCILVKMLIWIVLKQECTFNATYKKVCGAWALRREKAVDSDFIFLIENFIHYVFGSWL